MTRAYAAVIACILIVLAGCWLWRSGKTAGMAECEAAHVAASEQARQAHERALDLASTLQTHITHTGDLMVADSIEASHETVRYIVRTVQANPAAAVCVAPDDSVQRLQAAVLQANAAAGRLRSRPASEAAAPDP